MISKSIALAVINESLETGADYSELFFEDSHSHSIRIENGKVEVSFVPVRRRSQTPAGKPLRVRLHERPDQIRIDQTGGCASRFLRRKAENHRPGF